MASPRFLPRLPFWMGRSGAGDFSQDTVNGVNTRVTLWGPG